MTKTKFDPFKDLVLDEYEQEIEDAINSGEFKPTPISKTEMAQFKKAAENTLKLMKKDTNMNIRVSHNTKIALQKKAAKLGLRYQTLVGSILHQYAHT
jgi:predicted DNA binding CopG/RHH family protein